MIMDATRNLGPLSIVAMDVGNTAIDIARWVEGDIADIGRVARTDRVGVRTVLEKVRNQCENKERQAIVIASVVPSDTTWIEQHIRKDLNLQPFVIGGNTPLPIELAVGEPPTVGVDRVCTAAAAFHHTGHACTVIDIGSAVTIDVIDDDGVFQGGTILPGIHLQAQALVYGTSELPLVDPTFPSSAVGKNTHDAIRGGLCYGMVGAIRGVVEQIAAEHNQWPQTVMTGGGSELFKDHLDFVDSWVPDLCLMGIGLAYMKRVEQAKGE